MAARKKQAKRKAPGRKPKALLPSAKRDRFLELMRCGNYMAVAARLTGVKLPTVHEWREKAEADRGAGRESPYTEFADALEEAEAEAEAAALAVVWKAASGYTETQTTVKEGPDGTERTVRVTEKFSPTDAMRFLERRHANRWGQKQEVSHDGEITHKHIVLEGPDPLAVPIPGRAQHEPGDD